MVINEGGRLATPSGHIRRIRFWVNISLMPLAQLHDLRLTRNQNLPIGKVLVMSGYLTKETLQATIEMQQLAHQTLYSVIQKCVDG